LRNWGFLSFFRQEPHFAQALFFFFFEAPPLSSDSPRSNFSFPSVRRVPAPSFHIPANAQCPPPFRKLPFFPPSPFSPFTSPLTRGDTPLFCHTGLHTPTPLWPMRPCRQYKTLLPFSSPFPSPGALSPLLRSAAHKFFFHQGASFYTRHYPVRAHLFFLSLTARYRFPSFSQSIFLSSLFNTENFPFFQ